MSSLSTSNEPLSLTHYTNMNKKKKKKENLDFFLIRENRLQRKYTRIMNMLGVTRSLYNEQGTILQEDIVILDIYIPTI